MVVLSEFVEGPSSSPSIDHYRFDVFLSFRGLDTGYSFANHLDTALKHANITTFFHGEKIKTEKDQSAIEESRASIIVLSKNYANSSWCLDEYLNLELDLESAIEESRASIIVLSKNYANSSWCLDELVLILEQRKASNHIVIPIFYHVDPQQSSFEDAIAEHKKKMKAETDANKRTEMGQKINRWKEALVEVVNLEGWNVKDWLETEFIQEIVNDVFHRLRISSRSLLPKFVGMDDSKKFITTWLRDGSSHKADILTIMGMGGIGKTSLVKYVYGLDSLEFDASSFIEDISLRCEKVTGLLDLQRQLYDDIRKPTPLQVQDGSRYTSHIENVVARKKVLLILDDIDSHGQLDALLGSKGFHPGSKIVITTRDACVTESCALFKTNIRPKHAKHMLQGLDDTESRQLFCFHAFGCHDPKAGYEEVSEKLVGYCEGHPLALEVFGRSLYDQDVAYWEEYIKVLEKEIDLEVIRVVRKSFDSLQSENDKELFKHIACFFVGMDRDFTETILKACDIDTRSGITNLIDRCLLRIGLKNELEMHNLLRQMGRFVVHQESPHKRSRLWCHEESIKVLKHKKGTENVLGLTLDMKKLENEKLRETFELKTDALSKMDKMMLLQLNYVQINGSYDNFPKKLRWLCMHGFLLKSIPSDLPMETLVALDLSHSKIESFFCYSNPEQPQQLTGSCSKDKKLLRSLKILNLSFCHQLRSLDDFEELPALERLIVRNCIGLVEVSESIGQCVELVFIDLRYCSKLKKLPKTIGMKKKTTTLLLDGINLSNSKIKIRYKDSVGGHLCDAVALPPFESRMSTSTSPLSHSKWDSLDLLSRLLLLYPPNKAIRLYMKFITSAKPEDIPRNVKRDSRVIDFLNLGTPWHLEALCPDDDPILWFSLKNNNLSSESLPDDFSSLDMLKDLCQDGNPIVPLPDCVTSLEHPPRTLRELSLFSEYDRVLQKVVFDPEMSPFHLLSSFKLLRLSSFLGTIPHDLKFITLYFSGYLVRLSLAKLGLSTESFPIGFGCLYMLEELILDDNPIDSMPDCVRSLPRLERLSLINCLHLTSVENVLHPHINLDHYNFEPFPNIKKGKCHCIPLWLWVLFYLVTVLFFWLVMSLN